VILVIHLPHEIHCRDLNKRNTIVVFIVYYLYYIYSIWKIQKMQFNMNAPSMAYGLEEACTSRFICLNALLGEFVVIMVFL
jgi:hypothetical protein